MIRKLYGILCVLLLFLMATAVGAETLAEGTCGDNLTWTLDDSYTLTISGDGLLVRTGSSTGYPWDEYRPYIQTLVLEEGTRRMDDGAFTNCTALTDVSLPDSLTYIEGDAFAGCTALQELILPKNLTMLYGNVFYGCTQLERVYILADWVSMTGQAFGNCTVLEAAYFYGNLSPIIGDHRMFENCSENFRMYVPEGKMGYDNPLLEQMPMVTYSPYVAQGSLTDTINWTLDDQGCLQISGSGRVRSLQDGRPWDAYADQIKSVYVTENILQIGDYAFADLPQLEKVDLPITLMQIGSFAFRNCTCLEEIVIPENIVMLETGVFSGCSSLQTVRIPPSVTDVGEHAFYGCTSLEALYFYGNEPTSHDMAAENCSSALKVYYTQDASGWTEEDWCAYPMQIFDPIVASGECGDTLIWTLDGLGTFRISGTGSTWDSDYWVGSAASYDVRVRRVIVEEGVTRIGFAFFFDSCMRSLELPDSLSTLGICSIYWSRFLEHLMIPDSVTQMEAGCLGSTYSLERIVLPEGMADIGTSPFLYNSSLQEVVLPHSLLSLPGNMFDTCTSLHSVRFRSQAPAFSDNTFAGCTLTAYYPVAYDTWTEDVRQNYGGTITWEPYGIGAILAQGTCGDNLTWTLDDSYTLTISGEGEMYDYGTREWDAYDSLSGTTDARPWQEYNRKIQKVVVKEGVVSIGVAAFSDHSALTEVVLPEGLVRIGAAAFEKCSLLEEITLPQSLQQLGSVVFDGCSALERVTFLGRDVELDSLFFGSCSALQEIAVAGDGEGEGLFSKDGVLFLRDAEGKEILKQYPNGKTESSYTIPDGTTVLDEMCFTENYVLTELIIPDSVTTYTPRALMYCLALENIYVTDTDGKGLFASDGVLYAREEGGYLTLLKCPQAKTGTITVLDGTVLIAPDAFRVCYMLENIRLPEGVQIIGEAAFSGCMEMQEIDLPDSVGIIDNLAFMGCYKLTSVRFPRGLFGLGDILFAETDVTRMYFEGDAPMFNASTFAGVNGTAYYPAGNTTWTEDVRQSYGGTVVWEEALITDAALTVESKTVYEKEAFTVDLVLADAPAVTCLAVSDLALSSDLVELTDAEWVLEDSVIADVDLTNRSAVIAFEEPADTNGVILRLHLLTEDVEKDVTCTVSCRAVLEAEGFRLEIPVQSGEIQIMDYISGDTNDDGAISSADAIYLLRHTLLPERYPLAGGSPDYNNDGSLTSKDAVYLLYHVMLPEQYPILKE